jgi:hypothetical protein
LLHHSYFVSRFTDCLALFLRKKASKLWDVGLENLGNLDQGLLPFDEQCGTPSGESCLCGSYSLIEFFQRSARTSCQFVSSCRINDIQRLSGTDKFSINE